MRRIEPLLLGLLLAIALVGVSARLLTAPVVTDILFSASGEAEGSGLEAAVARDLAQQARAYVTGATPGPLPASVDGREGFSASAVSHLDDVRRVFALAGWATLGVLVTAAAWIAMRWRGGRRDVIASAFRDAALWVLVGVPVLVVLALVDFDRFFAGFHALFFEAGTWQFAADELLIQLFPEVFWASAGALWGALVVVGAAAMYAGARSLRARMMRDRSS